MQDAGYGLDYFFLGLGVGAAVGLLLAPKILQGNQELFTNEDARER
jgi:hypothetical protein